MQAALDKREESCTRLQLENQELQVLQARLNAALERAGVTAAELLREDERKVRMMKTEKKLEDEMKELHTCISEQQKALKAALKENDTLRRQLEGRACVPLHGDSVQADALATDLTPRPVEPSAHPSYPPQVGQEAAACLARPPHVAAQTPGQGSRPGTSDVDSGSQLPATGKPVPPEDARPWPMRYGRHVAPLRAPSQLPKSARAPHELCVVVRLSPPAVVRGHEEGQKVEEVKLVLQSTDLASVVKQKLVEAGMYWQASVQLPLVLEGRDETEAHALAEGHLLLNGKPLKPETALQDQGVRTGSELRLLRSRSYMGRLRCHGFHAVGGPRGILMNAQTWVPRGTRDAAEGFFEDVEQRDLAGMLHYSLAKRGLTKPEYKT
eukprot:TRINITY_DN57949_c0_g1_i1.p1 TRINITY_DN57949_c0_g1~~TRINITY_DN57949_c0_g1_i1.p1  ORF type:complete len:446 (+),score=96.72 TRINITY_DN57949_c0_g1_i1:194-1339(+)